MLQTGQYHHLWLRQASSTGPDNGGHVPLIGSAVVPGDAADYSAEDGDSDDGVDGESGARVLSGGARRLCGKPLVSMNLSGETVIYDDGPERVPWGDRARTLRGKGRIN